MNFIFFQKQIKNTLNNPINSIMIFWYFGENQKNAFLGSGHFGVAMLIFIHAHRFRRTSARSDESSVSAGNIARSPLAVTP